MNDLDILKCPGCGLLWRSTFELPERHYTEKAVDLSEAKLRARMENCLDRANTFRKWINLDNLCDLGTGEGMFLKVLRDSGFKNCFGIEPSGEISSFAVENKLDIYKGTTEDLPKISESRDINVVSMFHLIEHLDDPKAALRSIYDSLPAGGHLVIETPDAYSYVLRKTNYKHELVYPEHLFLYNPENMNSLLKDIGFRVLVWGRRDFNPQSLNLRDILFKLGLSRERAQGDKMNVILSKPQTTRANRNYLRNVIYKAVKRAMSLLIKALGRSDYFWIIAEK